MTTLCRTINAGLNASPAETTQAVNLFLAGVNPISVVSFDKAFFGRTGEQINIKLCYQTGGAQYTALFFQSDASQTADQKANTFFAGNPAFRAPYILDISNPYLRSLIKDVCLVLSISDFSIDIQANKYMAIVEPTAPILAGATGTFNIIGSTGALGSVLTAVNRDIGAWGPGEYGWAATDPVTGIWQAWSTCCQ